MITELSFQGNGQVYLKKRLYLEMKSVDGNEVSGVIWFVVSSDH